MPWEKDVTLCIAATCLNNITDKAGQPAIVLCADMMVSAGSYGSETEFKRVDIGPYVALFSGFVPEARELLSSYADHLARNQLRDPLSTIERLEQMRRPLEDHKQRKVENLVRLRLGIGHKEFLDRGGQIDDIIRSQINSEIWALSVEVDLLMACVVPAPSVFDRAFIFRLAREKFEVHKNFACIGEGAEAAEQSLHRRRQSELKNLSETLYNVYEAKKMGEVSPSVGQQTMLVILEPDDGGTVPWRVREVTWEGKQYLDDCFSRYGPKGFAHGDIAFSAAFVDDIPTPPVPPLVDQS